MTDKFCVDCKHCALEVWCARTIVGINLVTGRPVVQSYDCDTEREPPRKRRWFGWRKSHIHCGPDARYFEPKGQG